MLVLATIPFKELWGNLFIFKRTMLEFVRSNWEVIHSPFSLVVKDGTKNLMHFQFESIWLYLKTKFYCLFFIKLIIKVIREHLSHSDLNLSHGVYFCEFSCRNESPKQRATKRGECPSKGPKTSEAMRGI